jgi:glycosyltransferase involved in cell wall biosynthesis
VRVKEQYRRLLILSSGRRNRRYKLIENPTVSVVVAAYNHEKYVRTLLESILAQTFQDFEVVIIDDGSSDSTGDIIEEYARKYQDKIRFVRQENKGLVDTVNLAFRMSRGKYIAPVGSDDVWLPEKLAKQVQKFDEDPSLSLVYTDLNIIDEKGNVTSRYSRSVKPYWGQITNQFFVSNFISGIVVMYKRELFEKYGYWDPRYKIASDYEFSLRVSPYIKVGYIDEVLALYRVHKNSSSLGNEATGIEGLEVRKRFVASHPNLVGKNAVRLAYAKSYFRIGEAYSIKNDRKSAIKYYANACCYNPLSLQGYAGLVFTLLGFNYYNFKQVIKRRIFSSLQT